MIKTFTMKDDLQLRQIAQATSLQTMLVGCESICKLYGCYLRGNSVSIVCERLGKDLGKHVKERFDTNNHFTEMEILSLLEQVLTALQYARERVIVI